MWGWIVAILVGALAGWIASMIMGSNAKMGAIANIIGGLLGALLGNFIAGLLNLPANRGRFLNLRGYFCRYRCLYPDRHRASRHGRQQIAGVIIPTSI